MLSSSARLLVPSIPSRFLLDALLGYEFRGYDLERLLGSGGETKNNLLVPGHRISIRHYSSLIVKAAQEINDASLGFLEASVPLGAFSVFCTGLAGCRSIAEAVDFTNQFYGLFTDQVSLILEQGDKTATLSVNFDERCALDYRFFYQSILLQFTRLSSWLLGAAFTPARVTFSFAERNYERDLVYLFGESVVYSGVRNTLSFSTELFAVPLTTNVDQVKLMLSDHERLLFVTDKQRPFSRQVRRSILLCKEQRWPEITEVAGSMKLSPHLLWRKLKKEGTTYSHIISAVKRDWALALLQDRSQTIDQISERLHFADVSAFHKAFKNWTGMKSTEYRHRLSDTL